METLKMGFIVQINRGENFGVIREMDTHTEWIFFLDELSKDERREFKIHTSVSFTRDESFSQFVVKDMAVIAPQYRKVV
jgi:hypothetical protein